MAEERKKKRRNKKAKKGEESEEEAEVDPYAVPMSEADRERVAKYIRPGDARLEELVEGESNPRLVHALKRDARDRQMAALRNADAEVLLPEESGFLEMEEGEFRNTRDVSQTELKANVDIRTANNAFSLGLDHFGPYNVSYTRNGKYCMLTGKKGHVAILNWKTKELVSETHVKDMVHDSCFLQNETWYALAQNKYVHIYDKNNVELHILKEHWQSTLLDFLPYHWLLVSASATGWIHWTDVSIGKQIAESNGRNGPARALRQNPTNGVMAMGHARGLVSMWTPNMPEPTVKMMCHRGPVSSIAFNRAGTTMVTAGLDSYVTVWDLRTYKQLNSFRTQRGASSIDISAKGLLAVGDGAHVDVYSANTLSSNHGKSLAGQVYMRVNTGNNRDLVQSVRFCPWEDVLGVGRFNGFTSSIIPGSGEPNIDTFESNPFMTRKQRREADVQALLDKAAPATIMMNPHEIGSMDPAAVRQIKEAEKVKFQPKMKSGGKNKASYREKRKALVAHAEFLKDRREDIYDKKLREREEEAANPDMAKRESKKPKGVLDRFDKGPLW